MQVSGTNYEVNFRGPTELILTGDLNRFWLTAGQPGGSVSIDGASNTFVFAPSVTPASVNVTGSANIFYLPKGSSLTLSGTGAAMSTIKYYQP